MLLSVINREVNGVSHSYLKETTTRQKRVGNQFGGYVCVRTRQPVQYLNVKRLVESDTIFCQNKNNKISKLAI